MNSVWSKFIMNNLSVGVRSVFSDVNCLSKLLTSLRCFWKKITSLTNITQAYCYVFNGQVTYGNEHIPPRGNWVPLALQTNMQESLQFLAQIQFFIYTCNLLGSMQLWIKYKLIFWLFMWDGNHFKHF